MKTRMATATTIPTTVEIKAVSLTLLPAMPSVTLTYVSSSVLIMPISISMMVLAFKFKYYYEYVMLNNFK